MTLSYEEQYKELLDDLLRYGERRRDRTGVGTRSTFGEGLKIRVDEGFPMLTLRRLSFKNVKAEVLWYLRGDTHIGFLHENGVHFWDPWVLPDEVDGVKRARVGRVYGVQWRRWATNDVLEDIDQVKEAERLIRENPDSRRIMVSAWNVADLQEMALPPCPFAFQLSVREAQGPKFPPRLSMMVYQRSCDAFVGLPHDVAGHALLLELFARSAGMVAHELTFAFGDLHLYENHVGQAEELLRRPSHPLPELVIANMGQKSVDDYVMSDLDLAGYEAGEPMRVEVAV